MKLKLKGRRFDTTEEIQVESRRVLDTSRKRFKNGGDGGTGAYMREGTTSRVMVVDRLYGEFYDLYSVSPECFGYTLVTNLWVRSSGVRFPLRTILCLFNIVSRPVLRTTLTAIRSKPEALFFPGLMRPWGEADRLPPSNTEVQK
jgi:hypothetical protein